jgi:hypothetical protein
MSRLSRRHPGRGKKWPHYALYERKTCYPCRTQGAITLGPSKVAFGRYFNEAMHYAGVNETYAVAWSNHHMDRGECLGYTTQTVWWLESAAHFLNEAVERELRLSSSRLPLKGFDCGICGMQLLKPSVLLHREDVPSHPGYERQWRRYHCHSPICCQLYPERSVEKGRTWDASFLVNMETGQCLHSSSYTSSRTT